MSPRRRRQSNTRTNARIPEEALEVRVLDLAGPLLARLGAAPAPEAVRRTIALTIAFWNAKAKASKVWGHPRPKELNELERKMTGKKARPEDAEVFALLTEHWRAKELAFDPRLVAEWSVEVGDDESPRLTCAMALPDGVEAEVVPSNEERVALGGRFLDTVQIRLTGMPGVSAWLGFPVKRHRGTVGEDGSVTVHTPMPTAVALFAEGVLPPIGGPPIALIVRGDAFDAVVLTEIRCDANGGYNDVAVLRFRPASPSTTS